MIDELVNHLKEAYYSREEGRSVDTVQWADKAFKELTRTIKTEVRGISLNTVRAIMNKTWIINTDPKKIHTLNTLAMFWVRRIGMIS